MKHEIIDTDNLDNRTTIIRLEDSTEVEVDVVELFENMLENNYEDENDPIRKLFKKLTEQMSR